MMLIIAGFYTRERLIKVYFRHNSVRVVLKNLLTDSMLTNFLRAPLPYSDENILLIRRSLGSSMSESRDEPAGLFVPIA